MLLAYYYLWCNTRCCTTYSRLSLSRNRRDSQKHFEISVLRHIRFVLLREKQFEQPNFTNDYVNLLLLLEIYIENIMKKGRNCSQEQFLLFSTICCNLILDFCSKTRTRFSLRDKRLFEITEVELTRIVSKLICFMFDGAEAILLFGFSGILGIGFMLI